MTCPDFQLSKNGRAGLGVVQPQSGLDYPLVAPSPDIQYLIADLHLAYDDVGEYDPGIAPAQSPLRIKYLYGIGCLENTPAAGFPAPAHTADIVIVDAANRVILDTTAPNVFFETQQWSADYRIYVWRTTTAVCRLVAYTTWPDDDNNTTDADTLRHYNKYLTPTSAAIDERAVYKMPRRLLTLRVRNGQTVSPRYSGAFKFANGYSTEIIPAAREVKSFRNNTKITFSAVSGSGRGKYGTCPEILTPPIYKINGVPGKNGDFQVSGLGCLWIRRRTVMGPAPGFVVTPSVTSQQQIGADCAPCCKCEDYADTAKYMNDTSYRYRLIGQRAENVLIEHEKNIERWNLHRTCSVERPLRLLMVAQRCSYIDIAMMLCNPCDICFEATRLTVTLSIAGALVPSDPDTQTVVDARPVLECGYTTIYAPGVSGGAADIGVSEDGFQFSAALPPVKSGERAYVQFRVKIVQSDPVGQYWRAVAYAPDAPLGNRWGWQEITANEAESESSNIVATVDNTASRNATFQSFDDIEVGNIVRTWDQTEGRARGPYIVTGVLTGEFINTGEPIRKNCGVALENGALPEIASAMASQALKCNSEGKTEEPC